MENQNLAPMLKNVLHRGYWKYKKGHYKVKLRGTTVKTVDSDESANEDERPFMKFSKAMDSLIFLGESKTEIEQKHNNSERFKFTTNQLENYDKHKEKIAIEREERREKVVREDAESARKQDEDFMANKHKNEKLDRIRKDARKKSRESHESQSLEIMDDD